MVPLDQIERRPCRTEYQIEGPMYEDSPMCACDTFAIGRCADCRTWRCGKHSALWAEDGHRYCLRCLARRRDDAARESAERQAAHVEVDHRVRAAAQERSQERSQDRLRAALESVGRMVMQGEPPDLMHHRERRNPTIKRAFSATCVAGHPSCNLIAGGGRKDAEATYEAQGWVLFRSRRVDGNSTATVFLLTDGTLVREEGGVIRDDYTGPHRPRLDALTPTHSIFMYLPDPHSRGISTLSADSLCELLESLAGT